MRQKGSVYFKDLNQLFFIESCSTSNSASYSIHGGEILNVDTHMRFTYSTSLM